MDIFYLDYWLSFWWVRWFIGLTFSLVAGHYAAKHFLIKLRQHMNLGDKPGVKAEHQAVPAGLMGFIERFVFTFAVGLEVPGAFPTMIGWLAIKMASNWNRERETAEMDEGKKLRVIRFSMSALLGGLVSMFFALLGGIFCSYEPF